MPVVHWIIKIDSFNFNTVLSIFSHKTSCNISSQNNTRECYQSSGVHIGLLQTTLCCAIIRWTGKLWHSIYNCKNLLLLTGCEKHYYVLLPKLSNKEIQISQPYYVFYWLLVENRYWNKIDISNVEVYFVSFALLQMFISGISWFHAAVTSCKCHVMVALLWCLVFNPSFIFQLILPECMKLLPLYTNSVLKSDALIGGNVNISTNFYTFSTLLNIHFLLKGF